MKKQKYFQQVHTNCGGEIIVVAEKKSWALVCKKCQTEWNLNSPMFPVSKLSDDFEDVKGGVLLVANVKI